MTTTHEFDAREVELLSQRVIAGRWEMMYGELLSGGDMALYSFIPTDGDDGYYQHIATFQQHGDELSDEANTASVATAELLQRAPDMLALIKRLALSPEDEPDDLVALQEDAQALLQELAREWNNT